MTTKNKKNPNKKKTSKKDSSARSLEDSNKKSSKSSKKKTSNKKNSKKRPAVQSKASKKKSSRSASLREGTKKGLKRSSLKSNSGLIGKIKRNPDGFGFFVCEDDNVEDVYVPKEEMFGVFSNDTIEISINSRGGKFGRRGKVLKVLERASERFIGRLFYNSSGDTYFLKDSAHNWGQELLVENEINAEEGELVLVEVLKFPDPRNKPASHRKKDFRGTFTGKVISSIGSEVDPNTDNIRILHEHSVPVEFTEKALNEARKYGDSVKEADKKTRKDLRGTPLITIDGVTAKDFDDAICVAKTSQGYKLTVAIADVSHYVKKGTALDKEAYNKGTSVYLANYVCPMLPEELSNGLCSLNPKVDRLCFCCEMNISPTGEVLNFEFFEAVMNSHARVTYGEAQEVLEGGVSEHPPVVCGVIELAAELSEILNKKRMKEGSIDFNVPSVKVLVNDVGEPTDLVKEERIFSHRLIEELMLVTNICSSKFLSKKNVSQLYRVHEPPEKENLSKLHMLLSSFLNMNIQKIKSSFDFQRLSNQMNEIEDSNVSAIAQGFILRSMKQAQYSDKHLGHFGLGFSHYAHFTSPIRRYPDLVIHRQIKSVLSKKNSRYSEEDVASMGVILSAAEQRAVKAERKVTSVKRARFFESHVGEEFDGYISSLVKFGAFVTLREYPLDGLIKMDALGDDHFIYDEDTWTMRGKRTGTTFRVGDKVRIEVLNVDVSDGKIDFALVGHSEGTVRKPFYDKFRRGLAEEKDLDKKAGGRRTRGGFSRKSKESEDSRGNEKDKKKSGPKGMGGKIAAMFSSSSSSRGISFGKGKKKSGKKK